MLSVFAEFERDIIRERIKAGIDQARKEGKSHGRPKKALKKAPDIVRLRAAGKSQSHIASILGIGESSVRRILKLHSESKIKVPLQPKILKAILWLVIYNNNKFVRGKSRSRKDIEDFGVHSTFVRKPALAYCTRNCPPC